MYYLFKKLNFYPLILCKKNDKILYDKVKFLFIFVHEYSFILRMKGTHLVHHRDDSDVLLGLRVRERAMLKFMFMLNFNEYRR